jgi:hypothetical protein
VNRWPSADTPRGEDHVRIERKGRESLGTSRYLGGVFGIALLVAPFAQEGSFGSARAFSAGFALSIGIAAGLSLAGAIAGLALPGRELARAAPSKAKA